LMQLVVQRLTHRLSASMDILLSRVSARVEKLIMVTFAKVILKNTPFGQNCQQMADGSLKGLSNGRYGNY